MGSASDQELELGSGIRLWQVVPSSDAHGFDARVHARVAGHEHHQRAGRGRHDCLEHVNTGNRLEVHVDKHDVEARAVDHLNRFFATSGHFDADALGAQHAGATFTERPVVIDDEGAHFFSVGSVRGGRRI